MSFNPTKDSLIKKIFSFLAKVRHFWQKKQTIPSNNPANLLETKSSQENLEIAWWAWLTVLSLDAPLVAVSWQILLAESFQLTLKPLHVLLLFATVWLIYVADRCSDSLVIDKAYTARHAFYSQYFLAIVLFASCIASVVLFAATRWLEPTIFFHGCLLLGIVLLYLANLHLLKTPLLFLPKELQIGIVFASGTSLSLWSQVWSSGWLGLSATSIILFNLAIVCFAILCFLNCSFISLWEKSVDVLHQQPSLARSTTDVAKFSRYLQVATIGLCALCIILPFEQNLKLAFVLSSAGLYLLNYTRSSIKLKRVLADVVLMSPLLVLVLGLIFSNLI